MTTGNSTKEIRHATGAPEPDVLQAHFAQPPAELEHDALHTVELLHAATPAQLRSLAPRLLTLLEDAAFGSRRAAGKTVRAVVVEAVSRCGYPFALQLSPDELPLLEGAWKASRTRLRRRQVAVAVVALMTLLGWLVLHFMKDAIVRPVSFDSPRPALTPEKLTVDDFAEPASGPRTLPEPARVVHWQEAGHLLAGGVAQTDAALGRPWAYAAGIDCLAMAGIDGRECARALSHLLEAEGQSTHDLESPVLARGFRRLSEESDAQAFSELGRRLVGALERRAHFATTPRAPRNATAERLATELYEVGKLHSAMEVAERCLGENPESLPCLTVAHSVLLEGAGPETVRLQKLELKLAQVLARAERLRCLTTGSTAPTLPPGCQGPP